MQVIALSIEARKRWLKTLPQAIREDFLDSVWGDGSVPAEELTEQDQRITAGLLALSADWWKVYARHWKQGDSVYGPFVALAIAIDEATGWFDRYSRTRNERAEKSERIAELCNKLMTELNELSSGGYPLAYIFELEKFADAQTRVYKQQHDWAIEPQLCAAFEVASRLSLTDLPALLEHVANASRFWGGLPQYIAKPNHPNARRLFFVRQITAYMVTRCGMPMRKLTLELAGQFFDCNDLNEADLSRLAPVPKRPRE